jgi:uncharacterized membrane protein YtjA (UPF0391 family)
MRYWTVAFLLLALIAGVMGLSGLGGLSLLSASGLFLAGVILALLSSLLAQKPDPARQAGPRKNAAPQRYGGA